MTEAMHDLNSRDETTVSSRAFWGIEVASLGKLIASRDAALELQDWGYTNCATV
jgi:hypothetical protein